MFKKSSFLCFTIILLFIGCASTSSIKRTETITIILKNGDKIEANVLDIWHNKVVFKAKDWRKAYEYGEVINVERIEGIRIADGSILSVDDYNAYRKGDKIKAKEKDSVKKETITEVTESEVDKTGDFQYEELKKKPIAEMTENEFKYFIMMKQKESNAQKEETTGEKQASTIEPIKEEVAETKPVSKEMEKKEEKLHFQEEDVFSSKSEAQDRGLGMRLPQGSFSPLTSSYGFQLEAVVESLIEAGLATSYISYLNKKSSLGEELTSTETTLLTMIEKNPKWQEKLDDLKYLNRMAQKTLTRAYLYNPDELSTKLGLIFDQDLDMDFIDLMDQLHRKFGEDVNMGEFRVLVGVLGESGGGAIKEILEKYASWQFVLNKKNSMVSK